jgi:2-polyprenyl-3-methyl-5-hydroxy-6-metoxy-1,4-benzoquinol methylase
MRILDPMERSAPLVMVLRMPFTFVKHRCRQPELMDQPSLEAAEHERALCGLRRINALSRTAAFLWPPIARLARFRNEPSNPLRVLDLATGGGDVPICLARHAARSRLTVKIDGCDKSPQAVCFARSRALARGSQVGFFVHDALGDSLPEEYDVVSCSLFLHHLAEPDAISLLGRMASAARSLVLVDDLMRSRTGYLLAMVGCHVLSRSRVVHVDGPVSVAAAFTADEALSLAQRAGLKGAVLKRHWPQRFLISWSTA